MKILKILRELKNEELVARTTTINNKEKFVFKYYEKYFECKYLKQRIERCSECYNAQESNCSSGIKIGEEVISLCALYTNHEIKEFYPTANQLLFYKITNSFFDLNKEE
ncbi:MAG: hypothetical protein ACRCW9_05985 [Cetobacterium sp.]